MPVKQFLTDILKAESDEIYGQTFPAKNYCFLMSLYTSHFETKNY